MSRAAFGCFGAIFFSLLVPTQLLGQFNFPPVPGPTEFLHDYASIIDQETEASIRSLQLETFSQCDIPVVVVTIPTNRQFVDDWAGIEEVAQRLFDHWKIGKKYKNGAMKNQGILLLVSVGDRRARIELGADWGRHWDKHCDVIMQRSIVRHFKTGDYAKGIHEGVKRLSTMALAGPSGTPRSTFVEAVGEPMIPGLNPMPHWLGGSLILLGIIFVIFGIQSIETRKWMVWLGGSLILFGVLYMAVLFLLFFALNFLGGGGSRWWDSDHDGFGSGGFGGGGGGGGFGGGFSGGGGSTGSW